MRADGGVGRGLGGQLAEHGRAADGVEELGEESGVHADLFKCRHNMRIVEWSPVEWSRMMCCDRKCCE